MLDWILLKIFKTEVTNMAIIYATLITRGKKTFSQVPDKIKDKVKEVLIDLDLAELAKE